MFSMARSSRLVVPELPHHIVQRGTRNQKVFFSDADRSMYLRFLGEAALKHGVSFLAWCLMDNHVHLIAVPAGEKSLAKCFRTAHSRYAFHINRRSDWSGHLWQYRFSSSPLGPFYLYNAVRYAEQNPVRAGIVRNAWDYRWSSAAYHTGRTPSDPLISNAARALEGIEDWDDYLSIEPETEVLLKLRKSAEANLSASRQWYVSAMRSRGIDMTRH